jgi:hypothetical protein
LPSTSTDANSFERFLELAEHSQSHLIPCTVAFASPALSGLNRPDGVPCALLGARELLYVHHVLRC